jgi:RP/EB family microtubule-associated protein
MAVVVASKSELLDWINQFFNLNYTKIEQCGNGVVYCLIFNALFPNIINIQRIQKNPNSEFQILNNYKLLQSGFSKVKISRDVNVERLIKCRLQDNLEFLQWFGKLWCENNKNFSFSSYSSSSSLTSNNLMTPRSNSRRSTSINSSTNINSNIDTSTNKNTSTNSNNRFSVTPSSKRLISNPSRLSSSSSSNISKQQQLLDNSEIEKLKDEIKLLNQSLNDITNLKDGLEIERNFYFNKLRDIEIICQNIQQNQNNENLTIFQLINDLMEIMYTTEDGFLLPDDGDDNNNDNNDNNNNDNNNDNNNNSNNNSPSLNELHKTPDNKENLSLSETNRYNKLLDSNIDNVNILNQSNDELFDDETF